MSFLLLKYSMKSEKKIGNGFILKKEKKILLVLLVTTIWGFDEPDVLLLFWHGETAYVLRVYPKTHRCGFGHKLSKQSIQLHSHGCVPFSIAQFSRHVQVFCSLYGIYLFVLFTCSKWIWFFSFIFSSSCLFCRLFSVFWVSWCVF